MPTYEYRCKSCSHEFELFQSMKDPVQKKCPSCKKLTLERLIGTGGAVIFKGSGFYQTDYRNDAYKKSAEADKPAEKTADKPTDSKAVETNAAKAEAKSEKKAESKPESKAESKPAAKEPTSDKAVKHGGMKKSRTKD